MRDKSSKEPGTNILDHGCRHILRRQDILVGVDLSRSGSALLVAVLVSLADRLIMFKVKLIMFTNSYLIIVLVIVAVLLRQATGIFLAVSHLGNIYI